MHGQQNIKKLVESVVVCVGVHSVLSENCALAQDMMEASSSTS